MPERLVCPLCGSSRTRHRLSDERRHYHDCAQCGLVFVPERFFLPPSQEKALYDMHENDPRDMNYRGFLSRLFEPMLERLPRHASGLDFGSGPGPALSLMFEEQGHRMRIYDHFYAPDRSALAGEYDFITATEVVEHLHRPAMELERLWSLLRPGGWLGIMTSRHDAVEEFAAWHYKNDPTHVIFFSRRTFGWLADAWGTEPLFPRSDVVLLQKPAEIP